MTHGGLPEDPWWGYVVPDTCLRVVVRLPGGSHPRQTVGDLCVVVDVQDRGEPIGPVHFDVDATD